MNKLINIASKFAKVIKDTKNATDIYHHLRKDEFFSAIYKTLDPKEVITLCLLIQGYKDGRELLDVYERCQTDMFSFSILHINDGYTTDSCEECGGDGNISCEECDYNGKVDCETCNGSGEDEEGEICDDCGGSGKVDCPSCGGDGSFTCDECGGDGETESDSVYLDQEEYASIDMKVFNELEIMKKKTPVDKVYFGNYSVLLYTHGGESYKLTDQMGETLFGELNDEPTWRHMGNSIRDYDLKDYADF